MLIIPAIDIRSRQRQLMVMRPGGGGRNGYRPWFSSLSPSASLIHSIERMVRLFSSRIIYLADLDGLQGARGQVWLNDIDHSDVTFWLDGGFCHHCQLRIFTKFPNIIPVVASETLSSLNHLADMQRFCPDYILSLDYRYHRLLGPPGLADAVNLWPRRIIIMSLARIGSALGPDGALLRRLKERHRGRYQWIVGGGVRNVKDAQELKSVGASAALVSSALHSGRLSPRHIARLERS